MMRKKSKATSQQTPGTDQEFEKYYHTLPNPLYGQLDNSSTPVVAPKPKRSAKKIIKRVLLTLLVVAVLAGGWVGWKVVYNSGKIFGWKSVLGAFSSTKLKGEDDGRVNILLAGNSADDPGHNGAELTDSIMIVSIDTKDNSGFMLSIPRDMYVDIPGHGYAKINEAYEDGEADHFSESGYAAGGMGLLEEVVDQNFGINSNYYALVNYSALRDAVNAVGGVTVNIQSSDPRGLYDPSPDLDNNRQPLVDLSNGEHTLNGVQALGLARARGDARGSYGFAASDFERTANQRLLLLALKDKASSLGVLGNPIKVGNLFDSLGNNVKTDMKLNEVLRLVTLLKKIPSSKLTSNALNTPGGTNYLTSETTDSGQSVLVPKAGEDDYSQIQAYVQQLISSEVSAGQASSKTTN